MVSKKTVLKIAEALRSAYFRGKRGEDMTQTIHELRDFIILTLEEDK